LQDRLVKELRLRGISDVDAANAFAPEFIAYYNRRFARATKRARRPPASAAVRRPGSGVQLAGVPPGLEEPDVELQAGAVRPGFTTMVAKAPTAALSAHRIGVVQGALFGMAGAWPYLRTTAGTRTFIRTTLLIGVYANWMGAQLAGFWSARNRC